MLYSRILLISSLLNALPFSPSFSYRKYVWKTYWLAYGHQKLDNKRAKLARLAYYICMDIYIAFDY